MESNHHQIFRENGENSGKLYVLSTLAKLILYFIIYLDLAELIKFTWIFNVFIIFLNLSTPFLHFLLTFSLFNVPWSILYQKFSNFLLLLFVAPFSEKAPKSFFKNKNGGIDISRNEKTFSRMQWHLDFASQCPQHRYPIPQPMPICKRLFFF